MRRILILGAGMVSQPIVKYLLNQPDYHVKMASRTISKAEAVIGSHERGQAEELNELNSALSILLKKREQDKNALEEKVLCNIKRLAVPYIEKLKRSRLNDDQETCLNILESNINDIISSFAREMSSKYLGLSPTEIQVANLIKDGKQTKKIADILNLSTNTIVTHRYKIRSKLGLKNKKVNLRAYLQSIQ